MKVRIVRQPSGLLNAHPWPAEGETIDLPEAVAKGMAEAGAVEIVETRPASKAKVETRAVKKTATKKG